MESRIVKFLVTKFKFLNSSYVKKVVAITNGVKNEYVENNFVNKNKVIILPSGSSIKKNLSIHIIKNFLTSVILVHYFNQED